MRTFILLSLLTSLTVAAQTAPTSEPTPPPLPEPAAPPPAPDTTATAPDGQWVYTTQYGWLWLPYDSSYTQTTSTSSLAYVYGPSFGWNWINAPWVIGVGPSPWFGAYGRARYGWWRTPSVVVRASPVFRTPGYRAPGYRFHPARSFSGGHFGGGGHFGRGRR